LSIDPSYQTTGNASGLSLDTDTNTCTGSLAGRSHCTFQVAVSAINQPSHFAITPKVCINNLNCVKAASGSFTVYVANAQPHAPYAYLGIQSDDPTTNYIASINTQSQQLVSTSLLIRLADNGWAKGIATSLDGTRAYVVSSNSLVYELDVSADTPVILHTFNTGTTPTGIALTPDATQVFVSNIEADSDSNGTLTVYNTQNHTTSLIQLPEANNITVPYGMQVSPDGHKLCVVDLNNAALYIYRVSDHSLLAQIPIGNSPQNVAITPDGTMAYINSANGIDVVDLSSYAVVSTIPLPTNTSSLSFSYDGLYAYTTGSGNASVYAINTKTQTIVNAYPVHDTPLGISSNPQKTMLWITSNTTPYVDIIDLATSSVSSVDAGQGHSDYLSYTFGNFVG
jgi:DNA-binding beta-propeller fold protein YncE